MYTGTLIRDLMATVERAEQNVQRKAFAEEIELEQLYDLPVAAIDREPVFAGAA
jgi:hypothetical protein